MEEKIISSLLELKDGKNDGFIDNIVSVIKYSNHILTRRKFRRGEFRIQWLGDIKARRNEFKNNILAYYKADLNKYPLDLCEEFYNYWSELSQDGKKMRFEDVKNKYFEIGKRLGTWKRNNKRYSNSVSGELPPHARGDGSGFMGQSSF